MFYFAEHDRKRFWTNSNFSRLPFQPSGGGTKTKKEPPADVQIALVCGGRYMSVYNLLPCLKSLIMASVIQLAIACRLSGITSRFWSKGFWILPTSINEATG